MTDTELEPVNEDEPVAVQEEKHVLKDATLSKEKVIEFYGFMERREDLRILKATGAPPPWTDDAILGDYRFTNVRRHHDKTSMFFIDRLYKDNYDKPMHELLLNCGMARWFGEMGFMDLLGWTDFDTFDYKKLFEFAQTKKDEGTKVFTSAYVISNGGRTCSKPEYVSSYVVKSLHEKAESICEVARETKSWRSLAKVLGKSQGMGGSGFMAKETMLDLTYTSFWEQAKGNAIPEDNTCHTFPDDWEKWTPIGPGGRRGIARIFGFDDMKNLPTITEEQRLKGVMELYELQNPFWNVEKYGSLSPTDVQFQLCEFDKYERARLGQGRPKKKYITDILELDLA